MATALLLALQVPEARLSAPLCHEEQTPDGRYVLVRYGVLGTSLPLNLFGFHAYFYPKADALHQKDPVYVGCYGTKQEALANARATPAAQTPAPYAAPDPDIYGLRHNPRWAATYCQAPGLDPLRTRLCPGDADAKCNHPEYPRPAYGTNKDCDGIQGAECYVDSRTWPAQP